MQEAIDHDVRVVVMTNSLAATDEPLVHFGYSRYRREMLKMGVMLYELSPTLERRKSGALGELRARRSAACTPSSRSSTAAALWSAR